jgi:HB1, ASXL, restriction endonuclease HTH domain
MTLVEAAVKILSNVKGSSLSSKEIIEMALSEGLIKPKSSKPWVHLQSAMRSHNKSLIQAGKREKFLLAEGKWKLN